MATIKCSAGLRQAVQSAIRPCGLKSLAVPPPRVSGSPLAHLQPSAARNVHCAAKKVVVEEVSFADVFMAMEERVMGQQKGIRKGDGLVMVESAKNVEQGQRCLALIARHVAIKRELAGALELDWPARKKWLSRLCEKALRMPNGKPLILDVFANVEAFGLSTYFAAEMVDTLAAAGAEGPLLGRIVEVFRSRRPVGCKGVASAYHRLLAVMRARKEEAVAAAVAATLKTLLAEAAAAEAPAAAAAAEEEAAPVPAAAGA